MLSSTSGRDATLSAVDDDVREILTSTRVWAVVG
jgi:hypothetical protein